MEFSKRTTKRKQWRQKTAINLQMQATAGFIARFVTLLGQWSVSVTRRDHPFSGVRGQFGLHAHLILRLLWIDCQLNLNCAKLCMHFLMQLLFTKHWTKISQPISIWHEVTWNLSNHIWKTRAVCLTNLSTLWLLYKCSLCFHCNPSCFKSVEKY